VGQPVPEVRQGSILGDLALLERWAWEEMVAPRTEVAEVVDTTVVAAGTMQAVVAARATPVALKQRPGPE
jgi:hypothetical protein